MISCSFSLFPNANVWDFKSGRRCARVQPFQTPLTPHSLACSTALPSRSLPPPPTAVVVVARSAAIADARLSVHLFAFPFVSSAKKPAAAPPSRFALPRLHHTAYATSDRCSRALTATLSSRTPPHLAISGLLHRFSFTTPLRLHRGYAFTSNQKKGQWAQSTTSSTRASSC